MILHKSTANDFTLVNNHFIENYMISANGEFVKIYLYLLHCSAADMELSLSSIADTFNHTENDVKRALAYWEKLQLLKLTYDEHGMLTDISFTDGCGDDGRQKRLGEYAERVSAPNQTPAAATAEQQGTPAAPPAVKCTVSAQRKKELSEQEEVKELLFYAEQVMGKTLSSTEVHHILYFYDELHFSVDLIEYLIEYCVSKGKRSISYIRSVALKWKEQGISTVTDAKKDTNLYHKDYYTILNAFGIKGRGPAQAEIEFMSRWIYKFGFSTELILEACRRTINRTHTPNFQYADKILEDWMAHGVHHISDIEKLNERPSVPQSGTDSSAPVKSRTSANKFNNFPQRKYNFEQLEQQILDC